MRMNNFLIDRKSVREYKSRNISRRDMRAVKELLENIANQPTKRYFDFILFEDGKKVYEELDGYGGYGGVMIDSPHYIGIRLREPSNEAIISASYYSEELMTELIELDFGTCWLTIKEVDKDIRAKALGEDNKNIAYLISFGNPKPRNPFDTVTPDKSSRDSLDELVFKEELGNKIDLAELEERGLDDLFYYIRFAPSTKNSQPWTFVLKKDRVDLYIEEIDGKIHLMDAGIIMYYFATLGSYMGLYNTWDIDPDINENKRVDGYKKIGSFSL